MDDLDRFFQEEENLGRYVFDEPDVAAEIPALPREPKLYLRNYFDPYEFFSNKQFKARYRFEKATVIEQITPLVVAELQKDDNRGLPVSPELQVVIALRFYSTGCFQVVVGDHLYLSQPTVCQIIAKVSRALATKWPQVIHFPQNLRKTKENFERLGQTGDIPGLPNIIGAIDCTHVLITRPRGVRHSEAYRNRYNKFSLNVQAVVGPDMLIYDIVDRWPGSAHDSRIFQNSRVHLRLTGNELDGTLVGDSGYACTRHMLTPVHNPTNPSQERYNHCQKKTRNVVERTFGVMKSRCFRFPCLKFGLRNKLTTTTNIIVACAVLHNIAKMVGDDVDEEEDVCPGNPPPATDHTAEGLAFRAMLIRNRY